MPKLNYSKQREAIRNFLLNTTSHPTADDVYKHIRMIYPNISLGTVYRNLALLVEMGEAIKIQGNDEFDHFDGNTSLHYHFICDCCKKVYDIDATPYIEANNNIASSLPGHIRTHSTIFFGTCNPCMNNKNTTATTA